MPRSYWSEERDIWNNGFCEWYEDLEVANLEFPKDVSQVSVLPDIARDEPPSLLILQGISLLPF